MPFGYNYNQYGTYIGTHTALRLERLVQAVKCDGYNVPRVVICPGNPPTTTTVNMPVETMASMMRRWLIYEGTFKLEQITISDNPSVWTSMSEIRESMRVIVRDNLPRNILAVTTWNHAFPRLWIAWNIIVALRPEWHVRFAVTCRCWVNMSHELLGTAKYVPMALASRFRRVA